MSHSSYYHGSDGYVGHCAKCGRRTGTCYDELCEDCFNDEPVLCPQCGDHVQPDQMEGSICRYCFEFERTGKMEEVESVWSNIH